MAGWGLSPIGVCRGCGLDGASGSRSSMRRGESIVGVRKVCVVFAGNSRSELLVGAAEVGLRRQAHGLCLTNCVFRGAGDKPDFLVALASAEKLRSQVS